MPTFDLDELVTTLSGGNGRVNPPPWRVFVTAIPHFSTLLHFRNTRQAGATSGLRDKACTVS
ncbi:hypothetical protein ACNKHN_05155 [Shigella flexneri]